MDTFSGVVQGITAQERQDQIELDVLQEMQGIQADGSAWKEDYTKRFKGADARNAETEAQGFYQKKLSALNEKWASNKTAARYIRTHGGNLANAGIDVMREYAQKQGIGASGVFGGAAAFPGHFRF
jgi:hypothetical protein